jgi:hypothetical protein
MNVTKKEQQGFLWDAPIETAIAELAIYSKEFCPRFKDVKVEKIIQQLNYDYMRHGPNVPMSSMNPTLTQRDVIKSVVRRNKKRTKWRNELR